MHRVVLLLIALCGLAGRHALAAPVPMSPVDMIEMPRLSGGSMSPDGRYFVYLETETRWDENEIVDRRRILDLETGAFLTGPAPLAAEDGQSRVWWKPDNSGFAYLETPEGEDHRQVHFFDLTTETVIQLTNHSEAVSRLIWRPDSTGFYFIAAAQQPDNNTQLLSDGWIIPPFESNANREIWDFSLQTQSASPVVQGGFSVQQATLSRDGRHLTYSRRPDHQYDSAFAGEIIVHNVETGEARRWTANAHGEAYPRFAPDGRAVAYIATVNADGDHFYEPKVFIKTIGKEPERLLPQMAMEALDFRWDQSGRGLFILGNTGLSANLYHYTISSRTLRQLTDGDHSLTHWAYDASSDRHIARIETAENPGEFFQMSAGTDGFTKVTNTYADWPERFAMPRQGRVSWRGRGGTRLEGLLVYPVGYEAGNRYPLVTITHGGPQSSSRFGTWFSSSYLPVLAGQGYMVFLPNHRGGTGYGDRFLRDMRGRYFRNAHHDVMDGIDALIDRGLADPDQLIKMGWSAGGHMVNKLITHTNRFKAASSGAGVADWLSLHGESDSRFARMFIFGGQPWDRNAPRRQYTRDSPLRNAWKVKTPTLFFVGENDTRVPPTQSILMYRAVQATGTPTVLFQAEGEPHNFRKPANQLFKINMELDWYAGFARGEAYEHVRPDAAYAPAPPQPRTADASADPDATPSP